MFDAKRPKLELLDRGFVEKIVDEALTLLDRHGRHGRERRGRAAFSAEAGARVDAGTQRVRLGRKLVEDCLASTPATIVLYDRERRAGPSPSAGTRSTSIPARRP